MYSLPIFLLTLFKNRCPMGSKERVHYDNSGKFSDLIPEDSDSKFDLTKSVSCQQVSRVSKYVEKDQHPHENSEVLNQPIKYEEAKIQHDVEDIDEELTYLDANDEETSEPTSHDITQSQLALKSDFLLKKSVELSQNIINQESNSIDQANQIVEQMKELLVAQFKQNLLNDKRTHYGITCSECKSEPIIGVRYK